MKSASCLSMAEPVDTGMVDFREYLHTLGFGQAVRMVVMNTQADPSLQAVSLDYMRGNSKPIPGIYDREAADSGNRVARNGHPVLAPPI